MADIGRQWQTIVCQAVFLTLGAEFDEFSTGFDGVHKLVQSVVDHGHFPMGKAHLECIESATFSDIL